MIYKLLHKLFGWDYIHWSNSADEGVARVHIDGNGDPFFWRYKGIKVLGRIKDRDAVTWLTCASEKYLPTGDVK